MVVVTRAMGGNSAMIAVALGIGAAGVVLALCIVAPELADLARSVRRWFGSGT